MCHFESTDNKSNHCRVSPDRETETQRAPPDGLLTQSACVRVNEESCQVIAAITTGIYSKMVLYRTEVHCSKATDALYYSELYQLN